MKLNVEMTNASLKFKFWAAFAANYAIDKLPSQGYSLLLAFFFFGFCLFGVLGFFFEGRSVGV